MRNLPGGCPKGYYGVEDDESGLCYDDGLGCPEGMIMKPFENVPGHGSVDFKINRDLNQDHPLCNGQKRIDGLLIYDKPDLPAYKFCKNNDDN